MQLLAVTVWCIATAITHVDAGHGVGAMDEREI
jgi:hypothetical protein